MTIRVAKSSLHIHLLRTRFPFRYGIATMTEVPHLIVRLSVEIDGKMHIGTSADNLVPKWFTKDPDTSVEHDTQQMLRVVRKACSTAQLIGQCPGVFDMWFQLSDQMKQDSLPAGDPPLLWGLGVSLVERAVMDALCRAMGVNFGEALRQNLFGIDLGRLYTELYNAQPVDLLPGQSLDRVIVRHTVGLSDPLTDAEISAAERVDDGLPQSLEACIRSYGLTHFKIKLSGEVDRDLERLRAISTLLDRQCPTYAFTLDANENFFQVEPLQELWSRITADVRLTRFMSGLIFVEQPLHRDVALLAETTRQLLAWSDRPDMIIDESGGTIESLPAALAGGYVGTSHKNCKGVIKGIAAMALVQKRLRNNPGARLIVSGEDLSNTGPVALIQDLAVVAALGIDHVERNGHHYFRGISAWPRETQEAALAAHPDLFSLHEAGFATLRLDGGKLQLRSVAARGFGAQTLISDAHLHSPDPQ